MQKAIFQPDQSICFPQNLQIFQIYKVCTIYNFSNGCYVLELEAMCSLKRSKYKINWISNTNTDKSVQKQIDHQLECRLINLYFLVGLKTISGSTNIFQKMYKMIGFYD